MCLIKITMGKQNLILILEYTCLFIGATEADVYPDFQGQGKSLPGIFQLSCAKDNSDNLLAVIVASRTFFSN